MPNISSVVSEKPVASAATKRKTAAAKFENWSSNEMIVILLESDVSFPVKFSLTRNEYVAVIQRALISLGFLTIQGNRDSKGGPDGKFGTRTISAVLNMRKRIGDKNMSQEVTKNDINNIVELLDAGNTKENPKEKKKTDIEHLPKSPKNLDTRLIIAGKSPDKPIEVVAAKPAAVVKQPEPSLSQKILDKSKKADYSIDHSLPKAFALSAINSAFSTSKNSERSDKAVMMMAKETFTANYLMGTNDLAGALGRYEKILRFYKGRTPGEIVNLGGEADPKTLDLAKYYVDNAEIRSAEIRFSLSRGNPEIYPSAMLAVDGFLREYGSDSDQYLQARYIKAKGALQGAALFLDYGNIREGLPLLRQAADIIIESKSSWTRIGGRYISDAKLDRLKTIEEDLSSDFGAPASKISDYANELRGLIGSMKSPKYPRTGYLPDKLC
ncbi:MAG: hypothetical protein WC527_08220 [Candidatus Margulisiibacteriota bacterium]